MGLIWPGCISNQRYIVQQHVSNYSPSRWGQFRLYKMRSGSTPTRCDIVMVTNKTVKAELSIRTVPANMYTEYLSCEM